MFFFPFWALWMNSLPWPNNKTSKCQVLEFDCLLASSLGTLFFTETVQIIPSSTELHRDILKTFQECGKVPKKTHTVNLIINLDAHIRQLVEQSLKHIQVIHHRIFLPILSLINFLIIYILLLMVFRAYNCTTFNHKKQASVSPMSILSSTNPYQPTHLVMKQFSFIICLIISFLLWNTRTWNFVTKSISSIFFFPYMIISTIKALSSCQYFPTFT